MKFGVASGIVTLSAVADTWKGVLALQATDTAGYQCAIGRMRFGPADNTPAEHNLGWRLARVLDVSAGGAGTADNTLTPFRFDSNSRASIITAKSSFTVEPTPLETTYPFELGTYAKQSWVEVWDHLPWMQQPHILQDQLIILQACCRDATALEVVASMEFDEG